MARYEHLLQPRTANVSQDAGFLRRAVAFIVDLLVLDLLVTAPFTPILVGLAARGSAFAIDFTPRELGAVVALFIIVYGYFVVLEYVLGQTVGMMLLGTFVQSDELLWRHLVRSSLFLPFFPFVLFWVIEPIAILIFKRGVLEHVSGTRTLHTRTLLV